MAKEMHVVVTHIRDAWTATIGSPFDDAHAKLVEWGMVIRAQFDVDNLHLTARTGHDGSQKVISAVKQLGSSVASTHTQLADIATRQIVIEQAC